MHFKWILLCNKTWIPLKHQGARVANKTNSLPTRSLYYLDGKPILFIFYDKLTYTNCQVNPSTTRVPNFRFPSSNSLSFFSISTSTWVSLLAYSFFSCNCSTPYSWSFPPQYSQIFTRLINHWCWVFVRITGKKVNPLGFQEKKCVAITFWDKIWFKKKNALQKWFLNSEPQSPWRMHEQFSWCL